MVWMHERRELSSPVSLSLKKLAGRDNRRIMTAASSGIASLDEMREPTREPTRPKNSCATLTPKNKESAGAMRRVSPRLISGPKITWLTSGMNMPRSAEQRYDAISTA